MIDMVAVNREVERGRAELAASSEGILGIAQRKRIWVAMDDPDDPEASYRHRTYLKIACVRHVQHYWDRTFPSNPGVEEMLALTQALIDRKADPKRAEERADEFFDDIMAHTNVTPDLEPAIGVADAASKTVSRRVVVTPTMTLRRTRMMMMSFFLTLLSRATRVRVLLPVV